MSGRATESVDEENTISASNLEVCRADHPNGHRALVLALVLDGDEDGQLEPVRVHLFLEDRQSVEEVISAIRAVSDELWPLS